MTPTRVDVGLTPGGLRLAAVTHCQHKVTDVWYCPPLQSGSSRTGLCDQRNVTNVWYCPSAFGLRNAQVSVHSPWGQVFSVKFNAAGVAEVPIDWTTTGIDPLGPAAAEQLATGWVLNGDKLGVVPLKIAPTDAERMRSAIGAATDTQYEVGAINEKATLSAELTEGTLVVGQQGLLTLAVTNGGPQPAYRVIAKLQSGVAALHGHQISFGRIDPGQTKIRQQVVVIPSSLDDLSALVIAQIAYFNGERFEIQERFNIRSEPRESDHSSGAVADGRRVESSRRLAVDCKLATTEVAPGEQVRIDCELRNLGSEPLVQVALKVAVDGVDSESQAPRNLPGAGSVKLELVGLVALDAKPGSRLPVTVRTILQGLPHVEQPLLVTVASVLAGCKARLTRSEYQVKRKRLQTALASGALTQQEFDKYDAGLVSCLQ